jgi:hypothetical protein
LRWQAEEGTMGKTAFSPPRPHIEIYCYFCALLLL